VEEKAYKLIYKMIYITDLDYKFTLSVSGSSNTMIYKLIFITDLDYI